MSFIAAVRPVVRRSPSFRPEGRLDPDVPHAIAAREESIDGVGALLRVTDHADQRRRALREVAGDDSLSRAVACVLPDRSQPSRSTSVGASAASIQVASGN